MTSKPKLNQPDVETTTTIPNITIEKEKNLELAKQLGIDLTPAPSKFEQCIKEWEDRGFVVSNHDKRIVIKLTDEATDGFIHISKRFKETYMRCVLSYDLIQLLSKTLKALENNNETK